MAPSSVAISNDRSPRRSRERKQGEVEATLVRVVAHGGHVGAAPVSAREHGDLQGREVVAPNKTAQQVGARVVQELCVLDQERPRAPRRARLDEKTQRHVRQHTAEEALVERRVSGVGASSMPRGIASSGTHGQRLGSARSTTSRRCGDHVRIVSRVELEDRAHRMRIG